MADSTNDRTALIVRNTTCETLGLHNSDKGLIYCGCNPFCLLRLSHPLKKQKGRRLQCASGLSITRKPNRSLNASKRRMSEYGNMFQSTSNLLSCRLRSRTRLKKPSNEMSSRRRPPWTSPLQRLLRNLDQ